MSEHCEPNRFTSLPEVSRRKGGQLNNLTVSSMKHERMSSTSLVRMNSTIMIGGINQYRNLSPKFIRPLISSELFLSPHAPFLRHSSFANDWLERLLSPRSPLGLLDSDFQIANGIGSRQDFTVNIAAEFSSGYFGSLHGDMKGWFHNADLRP
jgi:hypothetical protein